MNKIKILIIVLVLLTIFLMIFLINEKIQNKKQEEYSSSHDEDIQQASKIENEEDDILVNLSSRSDYFIIKNNIDNYVNCINFIKANPSEENKNRAFDKLDFTYINYKNITKENIQELYKDYAEDNEFYIDKVYVKDVNQIVNIYVIYGRLINKTDSTSQSYSFIMQNDQGNKTFSLILYDYMKEKNLLNLKEGDLLDLQTTDNVEIKQYNTFKIKLYSEEEVIKEYCKRLKNDIEYDKDHLYNILDSEYREKRFNSKYEFDNYIKKLNEQKINLNEYTIDQENNMYICRDELGMYYIFKINSILDYTIILDTYTIDLPEFLEKYNSTNEQGKCALNIQKFMQAINAKDYNYAYNCLSDGFKNNYFKTEEVFEQYISNKLYNNNKVEYKEFLEESGLYKYTIVITDSENGNNSIEKTIIMKLNEGTDFELSFNV